MSNIVCWMKREKKCQLFWCMWKFCEVECNFQQNSQKITREITCKSPQKRKGLFLEPYCPLKCSKHFFRLFFHTGTKYALFWVYFFFIFFWFFFFFTAILSIFFSKVLVAPPPHGLNHEGGIVLGDHYLWILFVLPPLVSFHKIGVDGNGVEIWQRSFSHLEQCRGAQPYLKKVIWNNIWSNRLFLRRKIVTSQFLTHFFCVLHESVLYHRAIPCCRSPGRTAWQQLGEQQPPSNANGIHRWIEGKNPSAPPALSRGTGRQQQPDAEGDGGRQWGQRSGGRRQGRTGSEGRLMRPGRWGGGSYYS